MPYILTSTANPSSPQSWVKMETESILSGHSEFNQRLVNGHRTTPRPLPPLKGNYTLGSPGGHSTTGLFVNSGLPNGHGGPNGHHNSSSNNGPISFLNGGTSLANLGLMTNNSHLPPNIQNQSPTSVLSNYSLNRNLNQLNLNLVPRNNSVLSNHTANNHYGRLELDSPGYQTAASLQPLHENSRQEKIEVQILPQDCNDWGDNTTAVTGLSDLAFPPESMGKWGEDLSPTESIDYDGWRFICQRYMGAWTAAALSILAFFSPILMVILPQMDFVGLSKDQKKCKMDCDGLFISFTFKLIILLFGSWALFFRPTKATMPRIYLFRACVCTLLFIFVFAFWLFYGVWFDERKRGIQYHEIVRYANSMVDALLFIHYLAILLIEVNHNSPQFYIKIVRSPDGESRSYAIGQLSIQRAAVWVLEKYYTDFPIYNPYLEQLPSSPKMNSKLMSNTNNVMRNNYKYFDVDGLGAIPEKENRLSSPGSRTPAKVPDRFFEEFDYERRLKKRKLKLLAATEEAFAHLARVSQERIKAPSSPMDPFDAAQSIFPNIARPLQKFLRITRQQPRHTMESILQHLANCLKHDMSARAFLEKYIVPSPVLQNDREHKPVQPWALICDTLLSRNLKVGTIFQLRQGTDVSLLCEIHPLPHFSISEEVIDHRTNRFLLRQNSETPV